MPCRCNTSQCRADITSSRKLAAAPSVDHRPFPHREVHLDGSFGYTLTSLFIILFKSSASCEFFKFMNHVLFIFRLQLHCLDHKNNRADGLSGFMSQGHPTQRASERRLWNTGSRGSCFLFGFCFSSSFLGCCCKEYGPHCCFSRSP